jgi:hypothetical protein
MGYVVPIVYIREPKLYLFSLMSIEFQLISASSLAIVLDSSTPSYSTYPTPYLPTWIVVA